MMRYTIFSITSLTVCIASGTVCLTRSCPGNLIKEYVPLHPVDLAIRAACDLYGNKIIVSQTIHRLDIYTYVHTTPVHMHSLVCSIVMCSMVRHHFTVALPRWWRLLLFFLFWKANISLYLFYCMRRYTVPVELPIHKKFSVPIYIVVYAHTVKQVYKGDKATVMYKCSTIIRSHTLLGLFVVSKLQGGIACSADIPSCEGCCHIHHTDHRKHILESPQNQRPRKPS